MKLEIAEKDLLARIARNETRLLDAYYQLPALFQPPTADWQGDKEGRALLAFVCQYKITGKKNPAMDAFMASYEEKTNGDLYFGEKAGEIIDEQQLSGHSWLLRGLCEYAEQFSSPAALRAVESIVAHLYLPLRGVWCTYPINRKDIETGGVSGSILGRVGRWKLSSDIGCAFMSIDGLSHAYLLTRDEKIKELLDEMIAMFAYIDKETLRCQTHCSLTAARGMIRMYQSTGNEWYLTQAKNIYQLYITRGMTATWQNYNWWGRPETWTEPCAIVDSLMIAHQLWKLTEEAHYRTEAARIYHNGLASSQRANGGAGTDTCVYAEQPILKMSMYEAYFCCTMRLSEGLCYAYENRADLWADTGYGVKKTENGVYMDGDIIYAEVCSEAGKAYRDPDRTLEVDGHTLSPLLTYYRIPDQEAALIEQKVLFLEERK